MLACSLFTQSTDSFNAANMFGLPPGDKCHFPKATHLFLLRKDCSTTLSTTKTATERPTNRSELKKSSLLAEIEVPWIRPESGKIHYGCVSCWE